MRTKGVNYPSCVDHSIHEMTTVPLNPHQHASSVVKKRSLGRDQVNQVTPSIRIFAYSAIINVPGKRVGRID